MVVWSFIGSKYTGNFRDFVYLCVFPEKTSSIKTDIVVINNIATRSLSHHSKTAIWPPTDGAKDSLKR